MKLPKLFVSEKGHEDKIESLLTQRERTTTHHIEEICKCYEGYMGQEFINGDIIPIEMTDKLDPGNDQITGFSRMLPEYKSLKYFAYTDCFLSALMISSKDNYFTLDLREVSRGEQPKLEGGKLLDCVGKKLTNKTLEILGDVGYFLGSDAKNCRIKLYGNAAGVIGPDAINCEIHITGSYGSLSHNLGEGTKVFHLRKGIWHIIPNFKR